MLQASLKTLLKELEAFGSAHDKQPGDAPRMLNITHDTGEFLAVLVHAMGARHILEIGTSNGYSTLWLADAAAVLGGQVTTVENAPLKTELAHANFVRAGLQHAIHQVTGDAGQVLTDTASASVDLVFLDAERSAYAGWLEQIARVLRPGGLLVVDNATSHAQELAPLVHLLRADPGWRCSLVAVGKGQFLAARI